MDLWSRPTQTFPNGPNLLDYLGASQSRAPEYSFLGVHAFSRGYSSVVPGFPGVTTETLVVAQIFEDLGLVLKVRGGD